MKQITDTLPDDDPRNYSRGKGKAMQYPQGSSLSVCDRERGEEESGLICGGKK